MRNAYFWRPPRATAGVTILHGPSDWQIIQRDAAGFGQISLAGTWSTGEPAGTYSIQVRLVDQATNAPATTQLDWQNAAMEPAVSQWHATLDRIPTGGLYRVETRIRRPVAGDRRALRGDCIHHLGVGDIYVVAGQSNASGTGKGIADDGPELGVHVFANDEKWKLAMHPLEDATATRHPATVTGVFHGSSPWLAFGRRILEHTGIPIGLIPTALGGSPLSMWVTDAGQPAHLFDNMMDMVRKAGGRVAGVLWHQGESDTWAEKVQSYPATFAKLVDLFRKHLGPDTPIVTGQLNGYLCADGETEPLALYWTQMREMQRRIANDLPNVYLAVTIDGPFSDEIHNGSVANVMIGHRYADLALRHVYGLDILADFPQPKTVRWLDAERKTIEVTFVNVAGDFTPSTATGTFTVIDATGCVPIANAQTTPENTVRITLTQSATGPTTLHAGYGLLPRVNLRDDSARCITPFSMDVA